MRARRVIAVFVALGPLSLATLAGCSPGEPAGSGGYVPPAPEARAALHSALEAWQNAPRPLPASFDPPGIRFVDQQRKPDQRLVEFRILGETGLRNARQYTVRLTLDPAHEPQLVRYNVFGRDPIWVFRLEDYEMISHWEHQMDEPKSEPTGTAPSK